MVIAILVFFIILLYLFWKNFQSTPAALYLYLNFLALLWYYYGNFFGYSDVVLRNKANLQLALLPEVSYFFGFTFLACFISLLGLSKSKYKRFQFHQFQSFENRFRQIFLKKESLYLFIMICIFMTFITLWHLNQIELSVLWENHSYLKISDPEGIGITSPILKMYHTLLGIMGLIAFTLFALSIRNRLYFPAIIFFLFGLYALIFKLSANSRWAAVMIMVMVPFLFETKDIKMIILCLITFIIGMVVYRVVLTGRGQYYQGLSAISNNLYLIYDNILSEGFISQDFLEFFLSNVLAGAKDLSLAIQKAPIFYPENYKILSFSPLISAIDGYDNIRILHQHKITSYMPFNFYAELYFFGWKYWVFAFLVYTLGLRILNRATLKYGLMGHLLSIPALFCFFIMQQYSIRTCFRYFLFSIVLILLYDYFQKRKLVRNSPDSDIKEKEQYKKIYSNVS